MKYSLLIFAISIAVLSTPAQAQVGTSTAKSIAIISVDAGGIVLDNIGMANLIRLELEKTSKYEVLDRYDVAAKLKANDFEPSEAFGKTALIEIGKKIDTDMMLTGSVQKYGSKIVFILRLIDVEQGRIIKSDVKEYIYDEDYLQMMSQVSLASLLGTAQDEELLAQLTNVAVPVVTKGQTLNLSGPRFGMQLFTGRVAERLAGAESDGGYKSSVASTVFASQHEVQYVNSGDFQALMEVIIGVNGIETNYRSPSLTLLQGLRYKGWEIGFGPVFRFSRTAQGFYNDKGEWFLADAMEAGMDYELETNIDQRGDLGLSTGLIVAVGRTFRTGHINLPVNFYYSQIPAFDSHVFGIMLGFNIAKSRS
jgi:TolB-like protein